MEDIERRVDEFLMSLPCRDQSPYPDIARVPQNKYYAQLLLDAFADGTSAEITAIGQYIHHHLTIKNRDVANLELCIALVEMQHLSTIGDLIVALGGEPRYWRSNQGYWQGSEVDYGTTTSDKLRMDIRAEEAAISGYQALLDLIKDERVRSVLERIVRDEEVHLKLFREAYKRYA